MHGCFFRFISTFIFVFIVFDIIFCESNTERMRSFETVIRNFSMAEITIHMVDITMVYDVYIAHKCSQLKCSREID